MQNRLENELTVTTDSRQCRRGSRVSNSRSGREKPAFVFACSLPMLDEAALIGHGYIEHVRTIVLA